MVKGGEDTEMQPLLGHIQKLLKEQYNKTQVYGSLKS